MFALLVGAALLRAELETAGQRIVERAFHKLCDGSAIKWARDSERLFDLIEVPGIHGSDLQYLFTLFDHVLHPRNGVDVPRAGVRRIALVRTETGWTTADLAD